MASERNVCPHCGAAQKVDSRLCDLCGSPLDVDEVDNDLALDAEDSPSLEEVDAEVESVDEELSDERPENGGFCTQCGTPYPVGARFCGSCGARIQAPSSQKSRQQKKEPARRSVPPTPPALEPPDRKRAATDRELGRQVLLVVGAALVLIIALFVITVVSRSSDSAPPAQAGVVTSAEPAPLPAEVQGTVDSLRDEIDSLEGEDRVRKMRELADFLVSHGRWDLAGEVQVEIAEATNAEADWVRSGNLYYDWMEVVEGDAKGAYARRAIDSYQRALQINPDNLDVRTDMAIAYQFDPENSVQAIAQTNMVLEQDSLHVQANFNRAIMLLRINRFEEATRQLNKVKRIVGDPQNPIYQRSEAILDEIQRVSGQ